MRIVLIYVEAIRRMNRGEELPPAAVADSARLIRAFVEDYHEKLEEQCLFPCFRKSNELVSLVDVLRTQHDAGRKLTDRTMQLATAEGLKEAEGRRRLGESLRQFVRMYEPHAAREDTVLFPEFHKMLDEKEYDKPGDEFEKKEDELFGEGGFEKNVEKVAQIEKTLGVYDLSKFTP